MESSSNSISHSKKVKYKVHIPTMLSLKRNIGGEKYSAKNKRKSLTRRSGCFEYDIFKRPEDLVKKSDDLIRTPVATIPVSDNISTPDNSNSKKTPDANESVISLSSDDETQAGVIDILNKIYGDGWKTPVMLQNPKIKKCISIKKIIENKKCINLNSTDNFDNFKNNVREDFESTRRPIIKRFQHNFKKPKNSVETSDTSSSESDSICKSDKNRATLKIKSNLKTPSSRLKPTVISSSDSDSDSVCVMDKSPIITKSNFKTPSKRRDSFINDSSSDVISYDSDDDSFKNTPAFYNNVDNKVRKNKLLTSIRTGNLKNRLENRSNINNIVKTVCDDDINDLDSSFAKLDILKPKIERLSFLESLSEDIPSEKCDLEALKYHKNFKKHREELSQKLFDMFNKNIFKHQLPFDMPLVWDNNLRKTAGTCRCRISRTANKETVRNCSIKLSVKVLDRPARLRNTLIHELCHAASFLINLVQDGHGKIWKSWTAKAMRVYPILIPIGTTHRYVIETKYVYVCENCGYACKRHSKSLDTNRKVCGKCRGRFVLHRKNKNGGLDLVKSFSQNTNTQNSFPMFVKNNYGKVKVLGLTHAEVMKKLSEMFKQEKLQQ